MLLPWEYGVRNLARRPLRTALTLVALATVVMLVFVVVGFIRGLEQSLAVSGDPDVVLVYSVNSEENIENSSIAARTPALLTASVSGTVKRFGITHVSPELYMGTRVTNDNDVEGLGLVRGVTANAPLVRRSVKLIEGRWPGNGEIMVGRLAAAKMGSDDAALAIGKQLVFEGQPWTISGKFAAGGAAYESEIWCRLNDFQTATQRQDLSLAALLLSPGKSPAEVSLFCKERTDLELRALSETEYYASLQQHYKPVRMLAWLVVLLVSAAGVFAGLNMMYGAVAGRIREIATLQAIGYRRRAILVSLIQEGVLLAAAGSLLSGVIALTLLNGVAVRFTMGAFALRIDSVAILVGCGVGLLLGVLGALPPALKALRGSVAISLKAV
ncbi:ABC-type transport system, involved in lipoprotein release, permease component [Neorhodopirellula lusitana]|uniref:ABC-type transport system, involved in lipoprotein release, permease component n=1 Tax=Neorhodopirellula lusitana TaxID=445327 RepID=A0ABY1Q9B2_9BACT|nr:ABC transporter permease [Neorhodopirellula lusitana]SMP63957.1 ABC-type transport system, involved in lipoprotein release, permease component [Neorhodopirellula lusitana]